jgi:ABC-type multidrug transport system fused ATPase/permease subunit
MVAMCQFCGWNSHFSIQEWARAEDQSSNFGYYFMMIISIKLASTFFDIMNTLVREGAQQGFAGEYYN